MFKRMTFRSASFGRPAAPAWVRSWHVPATVSLAVLLLVNVVVFYRHYAGIAVFPWDFIGGYHAGAYSYFRELYFGHLQEWEPHGTLGYPTALALQGSSYYWPFLLLTGLGVPYTHQVAASVQALHVLLGSVGMLALLRSRGVGWAVATLGAVAFMLSGGFFSNAQHVDIVRGGAYLPWLFLVFSPRLIIARRWMMPVGVLVLAGFLAGAYPGIVVAAAYALFLYFTVGLLSLRQWQERLIALRNALLVGLAAVLLVMPKYLPLAALGDELALIPPGDRARLGPVHLFMLFFGFRSEGLPHDLTIRSLFLSPLIVLALVFATRQSLKANLDFLGVGLLACALAIASPLSDVLIRVLPGTAMSRLFLSDYRPLIHIALIVLSCGALETARRQAVASLRRRLVLAIGGLLLLTLVAYMVLESADVLAGITGLALTAVWGAFIAYRDNLRQGGPLAAAAVVVVVVGSWAFWDQYRVVWVMKGFPEYARSHWQFDFEDFYEQPRRRGEAYLRLPESLARRPERQHFATVHEFGIGGLYTGSYVDLAHDSGLRLRRNLLLLDAKSKDATLDRFVMSPSAWVVVAPDELGDPARIGACLAGGCDPRPVTIHLKGFTRGGGRYAVEAEEPFALLENELYFPGWAGHLRQGDAPRAGAVPLQAREGAYGFRGWVLPAGSYELETYYALPYRTPSFAAAGLGALLLLSFAWVPRSRERAPGVERAEKPPGAGG